MTYDTNRHVELKKAARERYDNLTPMYCKPLKAEVYFNSDGYYHMIFKSNREKRNVADQSARLNLIPLIKPVLYQAKKIHETRIDEVTVAGVKKTRTCYSFIEYVGDGLHAKVKVVVRQTGAGNYYFHSVMKMNKSTKKSKTPPSQGV